MSVFNVSPKVDVDLVRSPGRVMHEENIVLFYNKNIIFLIIEGFIFLHLD